MKESVLILGASAAQLPLVEYVKSRGYSVIVVSIPGNYPCFDIADKCIFCDVTDTKKILSNIKEENVVAVLTDQTDICVSTVAEICKELNLSGNDIDIAKCYSNKYLIRKTCDSLSLPNVSYLRSNDIETIKNEWNIFPAIIKPEDSQGSRGIKLINNADEIELYFNDAIRFSRTGYVIIEEYFEGHEVVVEGFVVNGEYINFGVADRKYFSMNNIFIPSQTIFPTNLPRHLIGDILMYEKRIHKCLRPKFGMIHSEYLVNKQTGEIRLVETALRGGGVYISSHLIPYYTNINNYELLLNAALGCDINLNAIIEHKEQKSSAYVCFHLPKGKVLEIVGLQKIKEIPEVKKIDFSLKEGDIVNEMKTKPERMGPILLYANTREVLEDKIRYIQQIFKVSVLQDDGEIGGILWD